MRRIIDKRKKEKFLIDDNYLNGQAKICGWQASLVYMSLCRHANKDQESFPSIQLISEELAISRPTVVKGLKNLEKYNVIKIQKKRTKDGRWLNNTYILLDKSQWIKTNQVNDVDTDQVNENKNPSQRELKPKSTTFTLRKHIEGNTLKETHILRAEAREGNKILNLLEDKKKHIQIIGLYAKAKNIIFENKEQQQSFIRRNLRPAKNLIGYPAQRIINTMDYLRQNADYKWTLETVGKFIDENLDTLYKDDNAKIDAFLAKYRTKANN